MGGAVGIFLAWIIGRVVTAFIFPTYLSVFAILGALAASGAAGTFRDSFPPGRRRGWIQLKRWSGDVSSQDRHSCLCLMLNLDQAGDR